MRFRPTAAALLLLAACAPAAAPGEAAPDQRPAASGACNATRVANLVGQPVATAEMARIRAGARTMRICTTGQPVTMDFRPDRLNVEQDASGRIVRLTCG
jgi:hypothetical protein